MMIDEIKMKKRELRKCTFDILKKCWTTCTCSSEVVCIHLTLKALGFPAITRTNMLD